MSRSTQKEKLYSIMAPEQCRAARALLNWSQADLEKASRVSRKTLVDFERGKTTPYPATVMQLRRTLEEAGVEFLPADDAGGPGVRLKRQ